MSRARDDARRNNRRWFALYHDRRSAARVWGAFDDGEGERVGAFCIGHADGCQEVFTEDGQCFEAEFVETHEPGSHDELHRVLVEPRRRSAELARRGVA